METAKEKERRMAYTVASRIDDPVKHYVKYR